MSAASFVVVLFFALTGLVLNHPKWIAGPKRTTVYRSAFDPEWTNPAGPSDVAKLDIVEELRSAPGDAPPSDRRESLYVLEGELVLAVGDRELRAPAGSWVDLPAGVPHTLPDQEPVRYLRVLTPSRG